jgi:Zn-dependent M16 (insulinase) family peptidase
MTPHPRWRCYAVLRDFHRKHYHPSNARIFTYGDMPLEDHLAYVEEHALAKFAKVCTCQTIGCGSEQSSWASGQCYCSRPHTIFLCH